MEPSVSLTSICSYGSKKHITFLKPIWVSSEEKWKKFGTQFVWSWTRKYSLLWPDVRTLEGFNTNFSYKLSQLTTCIVFIFFSTISNTTFKILLSKYMQKDVFVEQISMEITLNSTMLLLCMYTIVQWLEYLISSNKFR